MNLNYTRKFNFKIWKIIIRVQLLDKFALKNLEMIITKFQIKDKVNKPKYF